MRPERARLHRRAVRLESFTISWNAIEAVVALLVAAEMLPGSLGQRIALCPTYWDRR